MNIWFCLQCTKPLQPKESYCDACSASIRKWVKEHPVRSFGMVMRVRVGSESATQTEINEIKRRVILPEKPTDGSDYGVGRRMENGRISSAYDPGELR